MDSQIKKKVLFLITKSTWGGAQRYVFDLATGIDQTKFEAVVALGGEGELTSRLDNSGIRVIKIDSLKRDISLKQEWAFFKELFLIIKKEKPDILHVNSSKAGGVGTFLGRLLLVPRVVFTAHGWAFNEDRPLWQRIIIKVLHWLTVMLSHRTIVVSEAILNQLAWIGVEKKAKLLYPGRNIGVMYEKEEARTKILELIPQATFGPKDKGLWLGNIAELHPIKRQSVLLASIPPLIQKYPELKVFIIGEGGERIKLETQIQDLKLGQNVFLLGAISEAARLLKAFDIFVFPSKSEAYGYAAHEAGLAGLPVVATRVGGLPEIITDRESGLLVEADDAAALTDALLELIDNKPLREELSQTLKAKMTARSLEKMLRGTESLYTL